MERKNRYLTTGILSTIIIFGVGLQLNAILMVSADWGMIPILPVSIFEPGQKAIVAWNGEKEILILSADVTSTANTTVLQIMPLPSNPTKIEEASTESFDAIQDLIEFRMPIPWSDVYWGNQTGLVEVVFHEQIGMHDITVVEAYDVSEFAEWMDEFLLKNGISEQVTLEDMAPIIEDYMARDFHFYVLDLIDTSSEEKSVEPILYEFNTDFLYYPLLITSPIGGDGKITLFLITKHIINYGYPPLIKAQYYVEEFAGLLEFEMFKEELFYIDSRIGELFEDTAWMTVLVYDGPLSTLTKDLVIITITGDLNFDGVVNINDIAVAASAFGSHPGHSRWNPVADVLQDERVDIRDLALIALEFGTTYTQKT